MRSEVEIVARPSAEMLIEGHVGSMSSVEYADVRVSARPLVEIPTSLVDGFVLPFIPIDEMGSKNPLRLVHRVPSRHVCFLLDQILVNLQLLDRSEWTFIVLRH